MITFENVIELMGIVFPKEKQMEQEKWFIKKFYGNYVINREENFTDTYYLWKDGTVHKESLGLDELMAARNFTEGYDAFGQENFALAPGYFRTYKEAESYLEGYMAVQGSLNRANQVVDYAITTHVYDRHLEHEQLLREIHEALVISNDILDSKPTHPTKTEVQLRFENFDGIR